MILGSAEVPAATEGAAILNDGVDSTVALGFKTSTYLDRAPLLVPEARPTLAIPEFKGAGTGVFVPLGAGVLRIVPAGVEGGALIEGGALPFGGGGNPVDPFPSPSFFSAFGKTQRVPS